MDWCDSPDLRIWLSTAHRTLVTLCEGLLTIQVYDNPGDFLQEVAAQSAFYLAYIAPKTPRRAPMPSLQLAAS